MALEDLYTPIDRCLADGVSFRGVSTTELHDIRNAIDYLIAAAIKRKFETSDLSREYA